jgi:Transposase
MADRAFAGKVSLAAVMGLNRSGFGWCVPASTGSDYWILVRWHQEVSVGRRGYPPEFRRKVLDLVGSGRSVADVARDLGISEQSSYVWRRQDRIDWGLIAGLNSAERPS